MKILKKLLIVTLAMITVLLVACDNSQEPPPVTPTVCTICADGVSDYKIVYSASAPRYMRQTAIALSEKIEEMTGVKIPYTTDNDPVSEKEILIGETNRTSQSVTLADREIYISTNGSQIMLLGVLEATVDDAVAVFAKLLQQDGTIWYLNDGLEHREVIADKNSYINLTVATYNLHEGGYFELGEGGVEVPDFTPIAEDIVENGVELIALQEIDNNTNRCGSQDTLAVIVAKLKELTGDTYYYAYGVAKSGTYTKADAENYKTQFGSYRATAKEGDEWFIGVGVISKYPIKSSQQYPMTTSKWPNNCVLLETVIDVDGKEFAFFSTHNDSTTIKTQLAEIYAQAKKYPRYMVAGDFNWSKWSDFSDAFPNTTKANHDGNNLVTTAGGGKFDNVIFSEHIQGTNARVVDNGHSDHFMFLVDVTIVYEQ